MSQLYSFSIQIPLLHQLGIVDKLVHIQSIRNVNHILRQCIIPRKWHNCVSIITPKRDLPIKRILLQLAPTVIQRIRGQRKRRKVKYVKAAIGPCVEIDYKRVQIALKIAFQISFGVFFGRVLPGE